MKLGLAAILFIIFAVLQFIFATKSTRKTIQLIPMLVSVIGGIAVFVIMFISQNPYATLLFIPVITSFVGSLVGFILSLITTKRK